MSESGNVKQLRDPNFLTGQLQDELYAVICHAKYDKMTLAETVGVIEFLKWNIINRADT